MSPPNTPLSVCLRPSLLILLFLPPPIVFLSYVFTSSVFVLSGVGVLAYGVLDACAYMVHVCVFVCACVYVCSWPLQRPDQLHRHVSDAKTHVSAARPREEVSRPGRL